MDCTGAYHEEAHYEAVYSTGDTPSIRQAGGRAADIARVVDFLCDERNSFINGEKYYGRWRYKPSDGIS